MFIILLINKKNYEYDLANKLYEINLKDFKNVINLKIN
jgi:hypothetical protein